MNPFVNPEFWLSLAFIIVLGLIFFSPVRQAFNRFFERQHQLILDQIAQAENVLKEAQNLAPKTPSSSSKPYNQQAQQEIRTIQKDFDEKIKMRTEAQKQDFQVRQKMLALHMKNNLRTELLNQVQKKVLKHAPKKSLEKDLAHLISLLKENRDILEHMKTP